MRVPPNQINYDQYEKEKTGVAPIDFISATLVLGVFLCQKVALTVTVLSFRRM